MGILLLENRMRYDDHSDLPLCDRIIEFIEATKLEPLWKVGLIYSSVGAFFGLVCHTLGVLIRHI